MKFSGVSTTPSLRCRSQPGIKAPPKSAQSSSELEDKRDGPWDSHPLHLSRRRPHVLCSFVEIQAAAESASNEGDAALSGPALLPGQKVRLLGAPHGRFDESKLRPRPLQSQDEEIYRLDRSASASTSSSSFPSSTITRLTSPSRPEPSPSISNEEILPPSDQPDPIAESMQPRWHVRQKPLPLCLRIQGAFASSTRLIPVGPTCFNMPPVGPFILSNSYESFPGSDTVVKMDEALKRGFKYALRFEHVSQSPFSSSSGEASSSSRGFDGGPSRPPPGLVVFNMSRVVRKKLHCSIAYVNGEPLPPVSRSFLS